MSRPAPAIVQTLAVPEETFDNDAYSTDDTTQGSEVSVEFPQPRRSISYYLCCLKIFEKRIT